MKAISAVLLGFLSLQQLHAQMRVDPLWECHGAEALTADQMISELNTGMDRQSHESAKCICAYMESLATAKDQRALPAIARYLDMPNPLTSSELGRHPFDQHFSPFEGRYPASEALLEFRQWAYPVLIQTIQSETTFTQKSENALEVAMWIGVVHPDRTIKMLVDAAAKTNGNQAKMLLVAAAKALTTWECERVRPACENVAIPKQDPPSISWNEILEIRRKPKPGDSVILKECPPGLIDGLPIEDQRAISAIIGKLVQLNQYDDDDRAEIEFTDADGVIHFLFVSRDIISIA